MGELAAVAVTDLLITRQRSLVVGSRRSAVASCEGFLELVRYAAASRIPTASHERATVIGSSQ